jgi:PAS domain S-box-containing protein
VLASSLDHTETLRSVSRLVVPEFADWCVVDVVERDEVKRVATVHADAERGDLVRRLEEETLSVSDRSTLLMRALTTGEPMLVPDVESAELPDIGPSSAHTDLVRALGTRSLMCVPMVAHGQPVGAICLASTTRRYDEEDLRLACELADRAALAVDNARLYAVAHSALERAAEERARAVDILESITDAFWAVDRDWRFTYMNHQAEMIWGRARRELLGRNVWDEFPRSLGTAVHEELVRALDDGENRVFEFEAAETNHWFEVHAYPSDAGLSVYFHDISERKRASEAQRLLIDTGLALAVSLDYEETVSRVARAAVPAFADFCLVDLLGPAEDIEGVAVSAATPELDRAVRELRRHRPPAWDAPTVGVIALRRGEPVLVEDVTEENLRRITDDPEHLALLKATGVRSALAAPLSARGRRIGVITFCCSRSGRRYGSGDIQLAGDLARRAAIAIDNARLFEEAQESSRAKSNFISVMSHEFRTPLTAIVGYTELMSIGVAGPLTSKQREQLSQINNSAWHLTQLIDEILVFSRVDAGRETIQRELVNLRDIVAKAGSLIEPVAAVKGLKVRLELPDHPVPVETDSGKVRQILFNVLSNAVKFTDSGEIALRMWLSDGRVLCEVRDTGIGIAEEHLERIFDSFWQVEQGTTRTFGGTGLGLTITRRLARLLGGDVEVASKPGNGSVFTVWLPGAGTTAAAPATGEREPITVD